MIRDRGNIKWTAMMLPEHVKLLRDWAKEDEYETKPELDEQKLEQMNEVICEAMAYGAELSITYFNQTHHLTIRGTIHYVDEIQQKLRVVSKEGTMIQVPFQSIVNVTT
ncbi:YolD-like family protein [Bacillus pinisoli]|uniref:YolD-like family protein n=1 Tax=Bacillus pinisoli TaxID=2901866 RepID=UPI001FF52300|nr:YolD-like family protein [Bacillus pinisoli]